MKLFTKSEIKKTTKIQENQKIIKGARIAELVDVELKKLNKLKDEYDQKSKEIDGAYQKLFNEKLQEIARLQKIKDNLVKEINQLEGKKNL